MHNSWYRRFGKRSIDLLIAALLLMLLSPLLLLIAGLVRWKLGAPVLFRQQRPGWQGRPFGMLKFRTMTDARDAEGRLLPDADRLTRFGRLLRASSLDELPELWNVLRGEMSLIGPRPLLMQYLPLYTAEQARRHAVRPGITGWAQVHGRNAISWEEKFAHDVWYVDHYSLWLDVRILAQTVWKVICRDGVVARGCATMPLFQGSSLCSVSTSPSGSDAGKSEDQRVIVLGAGGHAAVLISTLQAAGWSVVAAYDDDPRRIGTQLLGVPVRGPLKLAHDCEVRQAMIGIGEPAIREQVSRLFSDLTWVSVIHPWAWVDPSAVIGAGSCVFAGSVIQPRTRIGRHVVINTGATVDHDGQIDDFANVSPGVHLAGNVTLGRQANIGIGACVIPGIEIGAASIIGAGAVVVRRVPPRVVALGCPARIQRALDATESDTHTHLDRAA